jgi:hypothetical protein
MVKFDEIAQGSPRHRKRGLVIGELLVALLLLAVAVSSLAALMYSVSRRPTTEPIPCVGKAAGCAELRKSGVASKLLKTGCAARIGTSDRTCKDIDLSADTTGETIIRSRTDSASLAMVEKKTETRAPRRPDRGFIR